MAAGVGGDDDADYFAGARDQRKFWILVVFGLVELQEHAESSRSGRGAKINDGEDLRCRSVTNVHCTRKT